MVHGHTVDLPVEAESQSARGHYALTYSKVWEKGSSSGEEMTAISISILPFLNVVQSLLRGFRVEAQIPQGTETICLHGPSSSIT